MYLFLFSTYGLSFWYSVQLINDGIHDVAEIIGAFFCILVASFALGLLAAPLAAVASARAAAARIQEVIERKPPIDLRKPGKKLDNFKGEIEFRNVTFAYPSRPDFYVLRNFSLKLDGGKSAAFVGASGCGKSSIVALVQRFYDPQEGQILVDGVDLREIDLVWWREQVGIVSQEPSLFSGTVMSNVKAGKEHVQDSEVEGACRDAYIHETIMKLPSAYETEIGTLGSQLSGGQKQRIAIARALIKKPSILLLDEATSALDRRSEVKVQQAIDKLLTGNRTTIVIAHRLVTIRDCDQIFYMERTHVGTEPTAESFESSQSGKVVENGTFKELLSHNGRFAALVRAQVRTTKRAHGDIAHHADKELLEEAEKTTFIDTISADEIGDEDEVVGTVKPDEAEAEEGKDKKKEQSPFARIAKMNMPECWALVLGVIGATAVGAVYPVFSVVYSEMVTVLTEKKGDDLEDEGPFWAAMFVVIAVCAFLAHVVQQGMLGYAGEYLTERLRVTLFRSLIRNEIAFFDEPDNAPGSLGAVLSGDTEAVHSLWGPALALRINFLSTVGFGVGIAFAYSWKVALVCLTIIPVMGVAALVNTLLIYGNVNTGKKDALRSAGGLAHEATSNVRTVTAFNMHNYFISRYDALISERAAEGRRVAMSTAFMFGISQFIMYGAFALAFWYGGRLVDDGEEDFKSVMTAAMSVLMASIGLGESSAMVAKFENADKSAKTVFALIDRVPTMSVEDRKNPIASDSVSDNNFDVNFKDVYFHYPTRAPQLLSRVAAR
eukprot:PhM_4_TR2080/c6_g1_i5/m.72191/K05658/ABCB1, CD243; ATP-binding cassette, subfamily B (MDR/TAP), member 1